ncbi:MAG TPA: GntR family transcriptional regulator [Sphingobium sp.]|nr:GntR family transcriptional regulator [Sphingobium sp.]
MALADNKKKVRGGARGSQIPEARRERLSKRIAEDIMEDIRSRGWPAGELLGTEAELMARLGVSRATLAEAVRHLERHGAASMVRGKSGGLRVIAPAEDTIVRTISTYLELADIERSEIVEAWQVMEVHAAGAAAEGIDDQGVAGLGALLAEARAASFASEAIASSTRLRIAVAHGAANPAVALFIDAMAHVLGRQEAEAATDVLARDLLDGLAKLVSAIEIGDAALAQGVALLAIPPRALFAIGRNEGEEGGVLGGGRKEKLAEAVARFIRADISERGWPVDEKLGEEAVLLDRYGTSRWVLRQALRVLEAHNIVRSKPGFGGGWMIGRPDPGYTVDLVVGYLRYADFTLENVADLWAHLIEQSIQLAGQRADDAAFDTLIAITQQQAAATAASDLRAATNRYYARLGELSGNRVIALIVASLGRFINQTRLRGDRSHIAAMLLRTHKGVAEALRAGRAGEARRLMAEYMHFSRPYYAQDPALLGARREGGEG